jgi:hypothetical protein
LACSVAGVGPRIGSDALRPPAPALPEVGPSEPVAPPAPLLAGDVSTGGAVAGPGVALVPPFDADTGAPKPELEGVGWAGAVGWPLRPLEP